MGLISGYLLYRAGRKRAEREIEAEDDLDLICDNCGLQLGYHINDVRRSCPTHLLEIGEPE